MDGSDLERVLNDSGAAVGGEAGPLIRSGKVRVDGRPATAGTVVWPGQVVTLRQHDYHVIAGGPARLQLQAAGGNASRIPGFTRVHCGYHKCLTEYAKSVYRRACRAPWWPGASFRHYFHRAEFFYNECGQHTMNSLSGHALDLERFEKVRVVRFVRDPRDLLVSGYFYHKRSAEHWCAQADPTEADWMIVRGAVPPTIPRGHSLAGYLAAATKEEGLVAELAFRRHHFASMLEWPEHDDRVLVLRYEDIVGNEAAAFRRIFAFLELPWLARQAGVRYARRHSAGRRSGKTGHIRNARSGQWREHFTPALQASFDSQHGPLLDRLGYPRD